MKTRVTKLETIVSDDQTTFEKIVNDFLLNSLNPKATYHSNSFLAEDGSVVTMLTAFIEYDVYL